MVNVSVSLKDNNAAGVDSIARLMDRPRSWIINDALEQYLAHYAWMDEQTAEAVAKADSGGEMVAHDDVVAAAEIRAKARLA